MKQSERNKFEFELKVFSRFLKENGIYSKYAREFTRTKHCPFTVKGYYGYIRTRFPDTLRFMANPIDRGLYWNGTIDGYDFWHEINAKWLKYRNRIEKTVITYGEK